jgi:hypothetical protein
MAKHVLSKSTFIRGLQCHKSLYLNKYHQDVKDPLSFEQQQKFKRGHSVGDLAQKLFPGGVMAREENIFSVDKALAMTQSLIQQGVKVIYEAAFEYDAAIALMDILVEEDGEWKAYEVKSSMEVKDVYRMDAAFQYYLITQSGILLKDIHIIFARRMYDPKREEPVEDFFQMESVLGYALTKQDFIKKEILQQKMVLSLRRLPNIPMGKQCDIPYPCDFKGFCSRDEGLF